MSDPIPFEFVSNINIVHILRIIYRRDIWRIDSLINVILASCVQYHGKWNGIPEWVVNGSLGLYRAIGRYLVFP